MNLLKNWKILLLVLFLVASMGIIGIRGIDYGMDFKGGTLFQLEFAEPVADVQERVKITSTIQERLDWTGLKDTTANFFGDKFVIAQVAEANPETIERMENLLKRQGRFEVTLEGKTLFTGEDIIEISKDPSQGYGFQGQARGVSWQLPFVLKSSAAQKFSRETFHKCTLVSFESATGREYDCEKTYFFIDRPENSVVVLSQTLLSEDTQKFLAGNPIDGQPPGIKLEEAMQNSGIQYFAIGSSGLTEEQLQELSLLSKQKPFAVVPEDIDQKTIEQLKSIGVEATKVNYPSSSQQPWLWNAIGLRQIISLSENVASMDKARVEDAEPLSALVITGTAPDLKTAQQRLNDLEVLLESGSLSVSVKSISKETITPLLGESFLFNAGIIGIIALIAVAAVIFVRYRVLKLVAPIVFISLAEVFITVAVSSLFSKFDLGAVAGLIIAVGTGVNDQIVITDELTRGEKEAEISFASRVKRAFFVVIAAAATLIAVMLPIILIGLGLGKLVGFAITTITGVLVGVLITRPAFGEIARAVMESDN